MCGAGRVTPGRGRLQEEVERLEREVGTLQDASAAAAAQAGRDHKALHAQKQLASAPHPCHIALPCCRCCYPRVSERTECAWVQAGGTLS